MSYFFRTYRAAVKPKTAAPQGRGRPRLTPPATADDIARSELEERQRHIHGPRSGTTPAQSLAHGPKLPSPTARDLADNDIPGLRLKGS